MTKSIAYILLLLTLIQTMAFSGENRDYLAVDLSKNEFEQLELDEKYRPMVTACRGAFFSVALSGAANNQGKKNAFELSMNTIFYEADRPNLQVNDKVTGISVGFDLISGVITRFEQKITEPKKVERTAAERLKIIKQQQIHENFGYKFNGIEFDFDHPREEPYVSTSEIRVIFKRIHLGKIVQGEVLAINVIESDVSSPISSVGAYVSFQKPLPQSTIGKIDSNHAAKIAKDGVVSSGGIQKLFNKRGINEFEKNPIEFIMLDDVRWVHSNTFLATGSTGDRSTPLRLAFICQFVFRSGDSVLFASIYVDNITGEIIGGQGQVFAFDFYNKIKDLILGQ